MKVSVSIQNTMVLVKAFRAWLYKYFCFMKLSNCHVFERFCLTRKKMFVRSNCTETTINKIICLNETWFWLVCVNVLTTQEIVFVSLWKQHPQLRKKNFFFGRLPDQKIFFVSKIEYKVERLIYVCTEISRFFSISLHPPILLQIFFSLALTAFQNEKSFIIRFVLIHAAST